MGSMTRRCTRLLHCSRRLGFERNNRGKTKRARTVDSGPWYCVGGALAAVYDLAMAAAVSVTAMKVSAAMAVAAATTAVAEAKEEAIAIVDGAGSDVDRCGYDDWGRVDYGCGSDDRGLNGDGSLNNDGCGSSVDWGGGINRGIDRGWCVVIRGGSVNDRRSVYGSGAVAAAEAEAYANADANGVVGEGRADGKSQNAEGRGGGESFEAKQRGDSSKHITFLCAIESHDGDVLPHSSFYIWGCPGSSTSR